MVYSRSKIVLFASAILGAMIGVAVIASISSTVKASDNLTTEPKQKVVPTEKKATETSTDVKFDLVGVVDDKGINDRKTTRLVDHLWSPEGEPLFGIAIRSDECITRNLIEKSKDPNTRYLIIGVSMSSQGVVDILQDVQEQPEQSFLEEEMPKSPHYRFDMIGTRTVDCRAYYIAKTNVDDLKNGYRLTYAGGPWKEEATVTRFPVSNEPTTVVDKSWGKVTFKASATLPRGTSALWRPAKKGDPLIYPRFHIENNRPTEVEVRLVYYLKGAKTPEEYLNMRTLVADLGKVVVETRQCKSIDFKNVAPNPDPAKWKSFYWAAEGRPSVVPIGPCGTLEGFKYMGSFYAPDGKNWRDYSTEFQFLWDSEHPESVYANPTSIYKAVINLDDDFRATERSIRMAGYLSDSSTPGQVVGEKVCNSFWNQSLVKEITPEIKRTNNLKFIQFKVELADEKWQVIGSTSSIDPSIVKADQKYLDSIRHEGMTNDARFETHFDPKGHFGWVYKRREIGNKKSIEKPHLVNWTPGDNDYRVVMLLKSGASIVYKPYIASEDYVETRDFGPDRSFNLSAQFDANVVQLTDIVSFRVEKRSYQKPFYVVATLPSVAHLDRESTASMERQWKAYRDWEAQMSKSRGVPTTGTMLPTTRPK